MGLLSFRLLAVIEHIHMVKCDFVAKAAQAHALLAEVAAAVTADTSGLLATEVLPEVLGAGLGSWRRAGRGTRRPHRRVRPWRRSEHCRLSAEPVR